MKVTTERIEVTRFHYRQEQGDPDLGTCLWAFFDVNAQEGTIMIQGDRGYYAYSWPEKDEEFWMICASMDGEYLMRKMMQGKKKRDKKLEEIWDKCIHPKILEYVGGDA